MEIIREGGEGIPIEEVESEISLRDYFAGQAMQGAIGKITKDELVEYSYEVADAMLVEREKR